MTRLATVQPLAAALANAAGFGKLLGTGIFVLGFIGPARFLPEGKYGLAAVTFGGLGVVGGFIFWLATRSDPTWWPNLETRKYRGGYRY